MGYPAPGRPTGRRPRRRGVARARLIYAGPMSTDLADGTEADQDVPHVHLHLLPRHGDDRIVIDLPGARATREDLDRAARRLAAG